MTERAAQRMAAIMSVDTLEIPDIPTEQMRRLSEKARQAGSDPASYVKSLIARDLEKSSLNEILAPFRQEVAASGITDGELMSLFEEAREDVRREQEENDEDV